MKKIRSQIIVLFVPLFFGNSIPLIAQEIQKMDESPEDANTLAYSTSERLPFSLETINSTSYRNPVNWGVPYTPAGIPGDGLVIDQTDGIGVNIVSTGSNAIQIGNAAVDGVQVQSAGRDGIRVSNAVDYGINVTGSKGAGFFLGKVLVNGDLTANNIGINSVPYLGTRISVVGNTGFSGNMYLTSGAPSAGFASNILEVELNSPTDPIADAWTTYSSRRWKRNIHPIDHALEKVKMLRGRYFEWKQGAKKDIGLIAEEVAEVLPEIVTFEENGVDARSVDYSRIVAVLIEAIKEQQIMIESLNTRLE